MKKLLLFIQILFLHIIFAYSQNITLNNVVYQVTSISPPQVKVTRSPNAKGIVLIPSKVNIKGKENSVTTINIVLY